jgi:hypothetical protein
MSLLPNAHLQYIDHLMREKPGFYRDVCANRSHYRKHRRKNHQMPKGKKHRIGVWRSEEETPKIPVFRGPTD